MYKAGTMVCVNVGTCTMMSMQWISSIVFVSFPWDPCPTSQSFSCFLCSCSFSGWPCHLLPCYYFVLLPHITEGASAFPGMKVAMAVKCEDFCILLHPVFLLDECWKLKIRNEILHEPLTWSEICPSLSPSLSLSLTHSFSPFLPFFLSLPPPPLSLSLSHSCPGTSRCSNVPSTWSHPHWSWTLSVSSLAPWWLSKDYVNLYLWSVFINHTTIYFMNISLMHIALTKGSELR